MVVGVLLASGAAVAFAGVWFAWWPAALLWLPVGLLGAAALRFFRDPERRAPEGDALLLAPADGVVVELMSRELSAEELIAVARSVE